mmetsp:Transcript_81917/g.265397  ORF Transcript_81917/g.265397 Transcript_81917/m.265397 type:complete len:355 (+) Transcript_81917:203-1267(+)
MDANMCCSVDVVTAPTLETTFCITSMATLQNSMAHSMICVMSLLMAADIAHCVSFVVSTPLRLSSMSGTWMLYLLAANSWTCSKYFSADSFICKTLIAVSMSEVPEEPEELRRRESRRRTSGSGGRLLEETCGVDTSTSMCQFLKDFKKLTPSVSMRKEASSASASREPLTTSGMTSSRRRRIWATCGSSEDMIFVVASEPDLENATLLWSARATFCPKSFTRGSLMLRIIVRKPSCSSALRWTLSNCSPESGFFSQSSMLMLLRLSPMRAWSCGRLVCKLMWPCVSTSALSVITCANCGLSKSCRGVIVSTTPGAAAAAAEAASVGAERQRLDSASSPTAPSMTAATKANGKA